MSSLSWSKLYGFRKNVRKRYPSVFGIPLSKKLLDVVLGELKGEEKILDVGASTRVFEEKLSKKFSAITYKTMDVDREMEHDFYSLEDIDEKFDVIIIAEVIEHIDLEGGVDLLKKLCGLLNQGGKIIVTTPNIHHPNAWMRDADHKVPYRYDVLGSVLIDAGFDIDKIFRIYNDQFIMRFVRIYLTSFIHRYFDIDFARTIVVVGSKSGS